MKKHFFKGIVVASILGMLILNKTSVEARATVSGWISGYCHYIPILQDSFTAYTTISTPTSDAIGSNTQSYMAIKVYNANGTYHSGSDTLSGGAAWDLPLDCGAKASIRNAQKAVGTHKARSYDTGYLWLQISDSNWIR